MGVVSEGVVDVDAKEFNWGFMYERGGVDTELDVCIYWVEDSEGSFSSVWDKVVSVKSEKKEKLYLVNSQRLV